ncbi:hypothetical protein N2152v2_006187 [Parachlorella kessleri]
MDRPPPPPPFDAAVTVALLRQRLKSYDTDRARERLVSAVVRGATAGLALRGGLHLVTYLLGLALSHKRGRRGTPGNARPVALELVKDTLRWGAFLGSFAGVFVTSDEVIALLGGKKRTKRWRAFASGAVAGPTLLLTGPKARHTSLAIYILIRGLALLIRCGNLESADPRLRALLSPTRWRHGDVALMCLSAAQIVYSWIVLPQTFPPSYSRFLNKHGGREPYAYEGLRELLQFSRRGRGPFQLRSLAGTPFEDYSGTTPCHFLHPGQPCRTQGLHFLPHAYLRALPVYVPVYIFPALLVHGRALVRPSTAATLWAKLGTGVLRSSLFLSGYCTLAWVGACVGFNLTGRTTPWVICTSASIAGLAVLVEKKSRRMELAMYCLSRVVEAFGLCLVEWGYVRRAAMPRRLDVAIFSLATACICHCYSDHFGQRRKVFRSKYLAVFDAILGNTGFADASIRHVPSNNQLIASAQVRLNTSVQHLLSLAGGGEGGPAGSNHGAVQGFLGRVSGGARSLAVAPASAAHSRSPSPIGSDSSKTSSGSGSSGEEAGSGAGGRNGSGSRRQGEKEAGPSWAPQSSTAHDVHT